MPLAKLGRSLLVLGLTIAVWCSGWGLGETAIAASETSQADATPPTVEASVISQALQSIPPGFYGILKTDQLKAKMAEDDPVLIDVRQPTEFLAGHIPGAVNMPLRSLGDRLDEIPRDRPVVLYCSTGYRTGLGVMALHLMGYDNVQGYPPSYQGWQRDNSQGS